MTGSHDSTAPKREGFISAENGNRLDRGGDLEPSPSANSPAQKPRGLSLEEWKKKALEGLSDQTKPFPRVW